MDICVQVAISLDMVCQPALRTVLEHKEIKRSLTSEFCYLKISNLFPLPSPKIMVFLGVFYPFYVDFELPMTLVFSGRVLRGLMEERRH